MTTHDNALQWLDVRDERFDWLNVADWEPQGDGLQPVRVPKAWRERWPKRTARRGKSAGGMSVRFRTDSKRIVFRATFLESPDAPDNPAVTWERARPSFFSIYRDGKYVNSVAALTHFTAQEVTVYEDRESREVELQVLLPFYYRNAEIVLHGIGIDTGAALSRPAQDKRLRVLFHGDSITHGHGVTSPRETYVWQAAQSSTACRSITVSAAAPGRTTPSRRRSPSAPTGTRSRS